MTIHFDEFRKACVIYAANLSLLNKNDGKINMRVWRNWQTHQIWAALLQWSFTPATVGQVKNRREIKYAPVMEMADMLDLGSNSERSAGSSPVRRTIASTNKNLQSTLGEIYSEILFKEMWLSRVRQYRSRW